ncbi:MAG: hypothetical protein K2X74_01565, partial [Acetobacteraceae bacterium]|nr:hypothetical protein [Acetobacteraceae bacterium]
MRSVPGTAAPPWYSVTHFTDADDLVRAVRHAGVEYVPLQAGAYKSSHLAIGLGAMTVQRVADQAHVTRGRANDTHAILLLPIRQSVPSMMNGWQVAQDEAVLLRPGVEIHSHVAAPVDWAAVALPAEDADCLLGL